MLMLLLMLYLRWKFIISLNSSVLFQLWSDLIPMRYLPVTVVLSTLKTTVLISPWAGWSL